MLFAAGAIASAINSVAGGGSLLTFPLLTLPLGQFGPNLSIKVANATNSVSLWPGSLGGAFGFKNLFHKTGHYLKTLFLPTAIGSALGSLLFMNTSEHGFQIAVPFLILLADLLLFLQPQVKKFAARDGKKTPLWFGCLIQFLVSAYGGYFGAGMGIMMLAAFALYIEGTLHELNAVKNWLGVIINFTCSLVFVYERLIDVPVAIALTSGSVFGGFYAAKFSQKINPDRLRVAVAVYGFFMALYFGYQALPHHG